MQNSNTYRLFRLSPITRIVTHFWLSEKAPLYGTLYGRKKGSRFNWLN